MIEATILGAGILAFLSVYMFFKLGENTGKEHIVLQLLLLAMIISSVLVVGAASFKATNCDYVIANATDDGTTMTYAHEYQCQDEPFGISETFLKVTQWFYRLFMIYLIIYFIYKVLIAIGVDLVDIIRNRFK